MYYVCYYLQPCFSRENVTYEYIYIYGVVRLTSPEASRVHRTQYLYTCCSSWTGGSCWIVRDCSPSVWTPHDHRRCPLRRHRARLQTPPLSNNPRDDQRRRTDISVSSPVSPGLGDSSRDGQVSGTAERNHFRASFDG